MNFFTNQTARLFFLFCFLTLNLFSQVNANIKSTQNADTKKSASEKMYWLKFKAENKYERTEVANLGFSIENTLDGYVYTYGGEDELAIAKKSNRLIQFMTIDPLTLDFPSNDSNFHNYAELTQTLYQLKAQYPGLIHLSTFGTSVEGRSLPMITISADGKDLEHPAVFFMGGHHAREHLSIETPLLLAQYLAKEYTAGNQRIVNLLNTRTVYIAPIINPDGAEFDIASGSYKLWRKNRRYNGNSVFGVDLNRNYGFGWGGGGASDQTRHDTFRGPNAFSEPETMAVKWFFESHKNITIDLTFHTFSALILYPWGHTYDQIPDAKAFQVHKTMAETMAKWNDYTPQQSSQLYIASGDTTDWAFGQLGIISFTFELDPKSAGGIGFNPEKGFYPGQDFIEPVFQKNIEPCLYLIEHSQNPYEVINKPSSKYGFSTPILE